MDRRQSLRWVLALLAASAAACTDVPQRQLTPEPASLSPSKLGKQGKAVQRDVALTEDIVRSVTVDRRGGKLEIPETGLKIEIPSNAIPADVDKLTITVTALAGQQMAYEFEPSGTTFRQPLRFEQKIDRQTLLSILLNPPVVAYFKSRADIDPLTGAIVTFEDLLTNLDFTKDKVKADVWHFSGYIVAWGKSSSR